MNFKPKLSTTLACRVAKLDRDRFNEAVASGFFICAPTTIPGRSRYFEPEDMVALWLYRELLEDGLSKERAGHMACVVSDAARRNPSANCISFVQDYFKSFGEAYPAEEVPMGESIPEVIFGGVDIRKVTTFNVVKIKKLIEHSTAEALSYHGPED